jgi:2-polyprenyl-3-methyl-5-hydroxy-6-metoxy-1,4-benzoquinol methylase
MDMTFAEPSSIVADEALAVLGCPVCHKGSAKEVLRAPDRFHGGAKLYRLCRCSSCSLVWLDNPPRPEEIGKHYGIDYDRSVAAAGDSPERWKGRVEEIAQYKSGGCLLDLGCSSGGFLKAMKNPSWRLHGIEMSHAVASKAESVAGAQVFVGDILDAPYAQATFDVITCFHVFEHVYDPSAVLRRVAEWLKPGGIFYVMVPNIDSAGCRIFGSYWYALELPRHLYHFSPKSLGFIANSAGLVQVSLTANREVFAENSVRYLLDAMLLKAGILRTPLARTKAPGVPFRLIRKAFRLAVLPVLNGMARFAGDGESIHAVFRKPGSNV